MAVVDSAITTTTASVFIPEIWSTDVLEATEFAAVIQKRVNTTFEDDMALGATYHVPRLSNLATQSKAGGVSNQITFEAVSETKQDITVATQEYAAFLLEQIVSVQANQDLRARYTKKIGYAIQRGREVNLAGLIPNLSTNVLGTLGLELTLDDYNAAWSLLAQAGLLENNPTPGDDFSILLSPAAYAAALKIDALQNSDYSDGKAIDKAVVGMIFGAPVFRSNLLNSPSAGQHNCAMFHRDCFALIVQKEIPVASQYMIRYLADGVVGWNVYGYSKVSFPPETPNSATGAVSGDGSPDTYTAVDNRGVLLKSV